MTLKRRWLLTILAFMGIGLALELGVGIGINLLTSKFGLREWFSSAHHGPVQTQNDSTFEELERDGVELLRDGALARALEGEQPGALEDVLEHGAIEQRWVVVGPGAVRSTWPACARARDLAAQLAGRKRAIIWCGEVPVLLSRVIGRGDTDVYLGQLLDTGYVDGLKRLTMHETELSGPAGVIATTFRLQSGARARSAFAQLEPTGPARFGRQRVELDGAYAGYYPETVRDTFERVLDDWLIARGDTSFDAFVYSAPLDERYGPGDLRLTLTVPAELLVLGVRTSGTAMAVVALLTLVCAGFLARRLVEVFGRPLAALETAARDVALGKATAIPGSDDPELQSLAESFNAMNAQLQAGLARAAQTEKMAALGTLAGGVAHEINNPLGVILGFAQGLERRVPDGDPLRMPVRSIIREALRCKQLVQEMLSFSRTTSLHRDEQVDVADAVSSSLLMLDARAKTQGVEIVPHIDAELPDVTGNRTQLQQVVMNLGTNALDAMKHGGTLTVRAKAVPGDGVLLEVEDTGIGIPDTIRKRIFEPFFTTKQAGEGTGLGLSLVYQIVQQHHGHIDVDSVAQRGTVMRVTLPGRAAAP